MIKKILYNKAVLPNQHGATVMAFVPLVYAIALSSFKIIDIPFIFAWLFLYLFSYPFLALFEKKPTAINQKYTVIYGLLTSLFALPILYFHFELIQFLIVIILLSTVNIYFAYRKNTRHIINDIVVYIIFGTVGMANFYLKEGQYYFAILIHPVIFFTVTTFYVKSMLRERKNPLYKKLNYLSHFVVTFFYALFLSPIAFAYLIASIRAVIIPKKHLKVKQIGMLEFGVLSIFTLCLVLS